MCAERRRARRGRPRQSIPEPLPDDLFDYADDPTPDGRTRAGNMPLLGPDGQRMRVTDDWPEDIPVTEAEIDVFERWFGDVFDELLNPRKPNDSLQYLSQTDRKKTLAWIVIQASTRFWTSTDRCSLSIPRAAIG